MKANWRILVIDDEAVMRESLAAWLREDGYEVETAASGREGIEKARETDYAIYFVDLKMPGGIDGIETMMEVKKLWPAASIVIITAYATVDTAITAMKEGALEYIVKPCNPQEISLLVTRIIKVRKLQRENEILRRRLSGRWHFHDLISKSPRMQEVFGLVKDVASLRSTVLITGESGTGKELIARALHFSGERAEKPFVGVSCAALTESLLESELFGYEKGAFTGAIRTKEGKFELANGGTLLLDEVTEMPIHLQAKLLRVLQEGEIDRVGGRYPIRVDARIIATTNMEVAKAVADGQFRKDLYYRLNVIPIRIPPLRHRPEDVAALAQHFIEKYNRIHGRRITGVASEAQRRLQSYPWPGNVRELENVIQRAVLIASGAELTVDCLLFDCDAPQCQSPVELMTIGEMEKLMIGRALDSVQGNRTRAAEILGISVRTLRNKLQEYRQGEPV